MYYGYVFPKYIDIDKTDVIKSKAEEIMKTGIKMIRSLFTFRNPWILFDNSIFRLGLNQKECEVLGLSLLLLLFVSILQERGIVLRNWFVRQCLPVRWSIYLCAVCGIWVLGTYGFGFDANDFIYGGF